LAGWGEGVLGKWGDGGSLMGTGPGIGPVGVREHVLFQPRSTPSLYLTVVSN